MTFSAPKEQTPPPPNNLPKVSRFITDHNESGEAIFSDALPTELPRTTIYNGASFGLGYATTKTPVSLNDGADMAAYTPLLPMHRTVSLDYGVVLEGEVDLVLDSGEVRRMRRGDLAVQRGTMHAWRNPSETEWCRMLYFLQECEPVRVGGGEGGGGGGRLLGEDYGDMDGHVTKSGN
ncbi:hypothetical protein PG993_002138 [Apiospora rasikravindrae]|uniref:Cupin 2 conserved barrel domain-containing protein n=1 Tax=Apiospora rasikravindrae TaxID=990691 RepID=A0ABR1UDD1_9PEZI